jgi:hypothetical protein
LVGLLSTILGFVGLGEAVATRLLAEELGEVIKNLVRVFARGDSSSSSEASTTFRRRRFAGGAISAESAFAATA